MPTTNKDNFSNNNSSDVQLLNANGNGHKGLKEMSYAITNLIAIYLNFKDTVIFSVTCKNIFKLYLPIIRHLPLKSAVIDQGHLSFLDHISGIYLLEHLAPTKTYDTKLSPNIKSVTIADYNNLELIDAIGYTGVNTTSLKFDSPYITTAQIIAVIQRCPNLTSVDLSCCELITDEAIIALALNCKNITTINLLWCEHITDKAIIALAQNCRNITTIYLDGCDLITAEAIIFLTQNCKYISILDYFSYRMTNENSLEIIRNCPNLTKFSIHDPHTENHFIDELVENCCLLTNIDLSICDKITDDHIKTITKKLEYITIIVMSLCGNLTDAAIIYIAKYCTRLTDIVFEGLSQITDNAVIALAENRQDLTSIDIKGQEKLTDNAIIAIAKNCKNITKLDISGCTNITDEAIIAIANGCPKLININIYDCNQITNISIKELVVRCHYLDIINHDDTDSDIDMQQIRADTAAEPNSNAANPSP